MKTFEEKLEELKHSLFMSGIDEIEDFLGMECPYNDQDTIDNLMDQVAEQMPEEEFDMFYQKYVLND